jgi:environmental stress-induced protein Ves
MIVLRESDFRAEPWKNGGGVTREIHRQPADPAEFDWRLSLATIDAPGPFSAFDGYDRTLVLVRGAGVELTFAGHGRAKLSSPGQIVSFDGAWQTGCALLDGRSTDLNLIVSTRRAESASRCIPVAATELIETAQWSETFVCCISGGIQLTNSAGAVDELTAADVARCAPADGVLMCQSRGPAAAQVFVAGVRLR